MATPSKIRRTGSDSGGAAGGGTPKKAASALTVQTLKTGRGSGLKAFEDDPLFKSAQALGKDVAVVWLILADILVDMANATGVDSLDDRAALRAVLVAPPHLTIGTKAEATTLKSMWKLLRGLQAKDGSGKQPSEAALLKLEGSAAVGKVVAAWKQAKDALATSVEAGGNVGGKKRSRASPLQAFIDKLDSLVDSLGVLASASACAQQRQGDTTGPWARAHGTLIIIFQELAAQRAQQREANALRRQSSAASADGASTASAAESAAEFGGGPAPPLPTLTEDTDEEAV